MSENNPASVNSPYPVCVFINAENAEKWKSLAV